MEQTKQRGLLGITVLMVAAGLYGLLFVFLIPPWQHYDEPTHFEYVWLLVNRQSLPEPGNYDLDFRADLVRSMIAREFFDDLQEPDPDNLPGNVAGLQYPQLDEPPLYYLMLSPALLIMRNQSLGAQLIGARTIGVLFYLATILLAWLTARQLFPTQKGLQLIIPMTVAFIPGFVDQMTAVNNDAGAVLSFSFVIFAASIYIIRPLHVKWAALLAIALVPPLFMKSTAFPAVPVGLLILALRAGVAWKPRLTWMLTALGALLSVLVLVGGSGPAGWYRNSDQSGAARQLNPKAVHGTHVLAIDAAAAVTPLWLDPFSQPLSLAESEDLAGRWVTVGAWMWADWSTDLPEAPQVQAPELRTEAIAETIVFVPTREPTFIAFEVWIPEDTQRVWISLSPRRRNRDRQMTVYYDHLALVDGRFSKAIPESDSSDPDSLSWGGQSVPNLLSNPSFEARGPLIRLPIDSAAAKILPDSTRPNLILTGLLDPGGSWWLYQLAARNLAETFWARFGWGHVRLTVEPAYTLLNLFSAVGVLGSAAVLIGDRRRTQSLTITLLAASLAAVWGAALVRSAIYVFMPRTFLPAARYAYPVIIPTVILLSVGWSVIIEKLRRRMNMNRDIQVGLAAVFLGLLNLLAFTTLIINYYEN